METTTYYHSDTPSKLDHHHQQQDSTISIQSHHEQQQQQQQRPTNDTLNSVKQQQSNNSNNNLLGPLSPSSTSNSSHSSMSSHGAPISDDSERDHHHHHHHHRATSSSPPSSYNSSYGSNSGQKLINQSVNNSSIAAEIPGGVVTTQNISTVIRPKSNNNSLQFVKINTPELSKKAVEQIKLAEETKISKNKIKEVEEEWQNNLLSWKSKRRQQFVHSIGTSEDDNNLERNNPLDGTNGTPRKVKTFAEMLEERAKSGTRIGYNLQKYIVPTEDEEDAVFNVHSVNHETNDNVDNFQSDHSDDDCNGNDDDNQVNGHHQTRFEDDAHDEDNNVDQVDNNKVAFQTKNIHDQDPMKYRPDLLQNTDSRKNMHIVDIGLEKSLNDDTSCDNNSDDTDKHQQHISTKTLNLFRGSSTPTKTDVFDQTYMTNINDNTNDSQQYKKRPFPDHSIPPAALDVSHNKLVNQKTSTFNYGNQDPIGEHDNGEGEEDDEEDEEEEEEEEEEDPEAEELRQKQKIAFEAKLKAFENLAKVEASSPYKPPSIRKTVTKTFDTVTTTFSSDAKYQANEKESTKNNEFCFSPRSKSVQGPTEPKFQDTTNHTQETRSKQCAQEDYKELRGFRSPVSKLSDCRAQNEASLTKNSIKLDCSSHLESTLMTGQKQQCVDSHNSNEARQTQVIPKQASSRGETVKINVNSPPISSRSMVRTINIAQMNDIDQVTDQMDLNTERLSGITVSKPIVPDREFIQNPDVDLSPSSILASTIGKQNSPSDSVTLTANRTPESNLKSKDRNLFSVNNNNNIDTTKPLNLLPDKQTSGGHDKKGVLSVSGRKRCSSCGEELGRGAAAFVVESLSLYYHTSCFRCSVCHVQLSNGFRGVDVRVHANALHCQNCYSKDGLNYSRV